MSKILALLSLLMLAAHPINAQTYNPQGTQGMEQEELGEITPQEIKELSETFGHFMGSNLKSPQMNLDIESVIKGIREGAAGKEPPMTQMEFQQKLRQFQMQMMKKMTTDNLAAAENFLAENKGKAGVVELEPGKLQYTIVEEGTGAEIKEGGRPQVEYTGKFLDGTEFGSSEKMGRPLTIPLDNTIPGFKKGLLGMKEGEKRILWIHPELGYGTRGRLQPNALLVFEIKVIKAHEEPTKVESHEEQKKPEEEENTDTSFRMPAW